MKYSQIRYFPPTDYVHCFILDKAVSENDTYGNELLSIIAEARHSANKL